MREVLGGMIVMAYSVAGLLFLRRWKRHGDPLFVYFSVAFWILGAQAFFLSVRPHDSEGDTVFYGMRLLAFLLILAGIWHKNRTPREDFEMPVEPPIPSRERTPVD